MFLVCFPYNYLFSLRYIIHDHISKAVPIVFSWDEEEAHIREHHGSVSSIRCSFHNVTTGFTTSTI